MERLLSLLKTGFWMSVPEERLDGYNLAEDGSSIRLDYRAHMTCFTELRPTQSAHHSLLYGLLGVVVDRQFILDRQGGPVQYVKSDGSDFLVGGCISMTRWLWGQKERLLE